MNNNLSMKELIAGKVPPPTTAVARHKDSNSESIEVAKLNMTSLLETEKKEKALLASQNNDLVSKCQTLEEKNKELEIKLSEGTIKTNDFKDELSKNNQKMIVILNPKTLVRNPTFYNRNNDQFLLTKHDEDSFRLFTQDRNYSHISYANEDTFLAIITSTYVLGGNDTPICFTSNSSNDNKTIIFGERRTRAVDWLLSNGYTNNGEKDVELQGFEGTHKTSVSFLRAKYHENDIRKSLTPIEKAITISQAYSEYEHIYEEEFKDCTERKPRIEGYILGKLEADLALKSSAIKKLRKIGLHLGIDFDETLGKYTQYISFTKLNELQLFANPTSGQFDAKSLATSLRIEIDKIINKHTQDDEQSTEELNSSMQKKVLSAIDPFINSFKPKTIHPNANRSVRRKNINFESVQGVIFKASFDEDKVSPKMSELLNDKVKLEDALSDFFKEYLVD
jgi:hypothetical protein